MKKAIEVLEQENFEPPKIVLLSGEDEILKQLITNKMIAASGVERDQIERTSAASADGMVAQIGEGSLFGERFLVIEHTTDKWGATKRLAGHLQEVLEFGDWVVIRSTKAPTGANALDPFWLEIECKEPTHKKTREKLVSILLANQKIRLREDALKKLVERTDSTASVNSAITVLSFLSDRTALGVQDVEAATTEPAHRRDLVRTFLQLSVPRLIKELGTGEPIPTLSVLHSTALKLYAYIEMSQAEVEVDEKKRILEISPIMNKEFEAAAKRYAPKTLRNLMSDVQEAYEAERSGRAVGWREKLQKIFRDLGGPPKT